MSTAHRPSDEIRIAAPAGWRWTTVAFVTIAAAAALAIGSVRQRPLPAPVGAMAAPSMFSAERAAKHVRALAGEPRPAGSPAHERAAQYLQDRVGETGLSADVQRTTYIEETAAGEHRASRVTNVAARLPGRSSRTSVLLAAHYDSTERSLGAGDNAAATAAMLETLRALRVGGTLANDVIFLWTDAEELGLVGARAFVKDHPWAKDVALTLNFDSRGSRGPAILLETGTRLPAWTVDQIAGASPYLVGDSFARTLYERTPHSTDFNIFRRQAIPGANFVLAEGWQTYHSMRDTADTLDLRSLQHQGDLMMALAQRFGGVTLNGDAPDIGARILFNPPGMSAVSWPRWLLVAIATAAAALLVISTWWAWRRGRIGAGMLILGLVWPIAAGLLGVFGGEQIVGSIRSRGAAIDRPDAYMWGLGLIVVGSIAAAGFLVKTPRAVAGLFAGQLWLLLVLLVLAMVKMPTAIHVIGLPLALGAVAFLILAGPGSPASGAIAPSRFWIALCVSSAALLFVAPVVWMVVLAAPGREYVVLAIVPLLVGFCLPMRPLLSRFGVLACALLVMLGAAQLLYTALGVPSPARVATSDVTYVANMDDGRALWLVNRVDAQTRLLLRQGATPVTLGQAFPEWYVGGRRDRKRESGRASLRPHASPTVDVVHDRLEDGHRRLRLRIQSAMGAPELSMRISARELVTLESVDGVPVSGAGSTPARDCVLHARAFTGAFEIDLIADAAPLTIQIVERLPTFGADGARRVEIASNELLPAGVEVSPFVVQTFSR